MVLASWHMASCKQDYLAKWHFLLFFWYILIFWAQKCWFIELNLMLGWDAVCVLWYFSKKNNQRLFTYVVQALQATKIYILIAQNKMKNTFSLFFFYNSSFIGWLPICCYTNFTKISRKKFVFREIEILQLLLLAAADAYGNALFSKYCFFSFSADSLPQEISWNFFTKLLWNTGILNQFHEKKKWYREVYLFFQFRF